MAKITNILYVVEGEIEDKYLNQLKSENRVKSGRVKKFNIMQVSVKPTDDIMKRKVSIIYCIIDTDCIDAANINTFVDNVKMLSTIGKVVVLVHNRNFEDELVYMLQAGTIKRLCDIFNVSNKTTKDLKSFLATNQGYTKKIAKEHLVRYCERPESFCEIVLNKIPKKIRISKAKEEIVL